MGNYTVLYRNPIPPPRKGEKRRAVAAKIGTKIGVEIGSTINNFSKKDRKWKKLKIAVSRLLSSGGENW